jgi:hypothetical protein
MRPLLTILMILAKTFIFGQSLSDKYLHFKTDYYWDTTFYKSEQDFYYQINHGLITQKEYPVLQYVFTIIISDSPLVTKDSFERRGFSQYPYKYIRKGNSIYLQYFDQGKRKLQLNREYSLNPTDTANLLVEKNSLDSKDGISFAGFSTYLGKEIIEINGKQFQTFHFSENHEVSGIDATPYIKEVFLEQSSLLPIKLITTYYYDDEMRQKALYSSVTTLNSSSNSLPDYTNKTTGDLVLYENKSTVWTNQQKQAFLKMFSSDKQSFAECLLKKLDSHISFFHFEQTPYFRNLLMNKVCD